MNSKNLFRTSKDGASTTRVFGLLTLASTILVCATAVAADIHNKAKSLSPEPHPLRPSEDSDIQCQVWPGSYQQVIPGETRTAELGDHLGEPTTTRTSGNKITQSFDVTTFKQCDVEIIDGTVDAIILYTNEPVSIEVVESEFELKNVESVPIEGADRTIIGAVYPERGLVISYADNDQSLVSEIVLQTITSQPFVMRHDARGEYALGARINDLQLAAAHNRTDAALHGKLASLLNRTEQYAKALESASHATKLAPGNSRYQLELAIALIKTGTNEGARSKLDQLVNGSSVPAQLRARAELWTGHLIADGRVGDHRTAAKHFQAAIRLANSVASSDVRRVRHEAIGVMINAHLAMAESVAWGPWPKKSTAVPKWLAQSKTLADKFIEHDGGDPLFLLKCYKQTLVSYEPIGQKLDLAQTLADAEDLAHFLIKEARDVHYRKLLESEYGDILYHAMKVENAQGIFTKGVVYGKQAAAHLEDMESSLPRTAADCYRLGRLYFDIGAVYAVFEKDHHEAMRWYDKALEQFEVARHVPSIQLSLHGDRFVSMGVSFWQEEQKPQAIELTEIGISLVQDAIDEGQQTAAVLAIPHSNLAEMYDAIGKSEEAVAHRAKATALRAKPDAPRQAKAAPKKAKPIGIRAAGKPSYRRNR